MTFAYADFARIHKEQWVKFTSNPRGDMPPMAIVWEKEVPQIAIMAPQVDKLLALKAMEICRRGLGCDGFTFIADTFSVRYPKELDEEQARAKLAAYKPGDMQRAFESGSKEVSEALHCVHLDDEGHFTMHTAPFEIVEKGVIKWHTDEFMTMEHGEGDIEGFIPDTMKQIAAEPWIGDNPLLNRMFSDLGPEKKLFHIGRAVRRFLHEADFLVLECLQWSPDPEEMKKRVAERYEMVKDIYDFDKMKTKDEWLHHLKTHPDWGAAFPSAN